MKKIKGVILAGGFGKRLRPLTNEVPKPLLLVGEKPLIQYAIENLVSSGVKDLIFVIQADHAQQFYNFIQDGKKFGAESVSFVWHPDVSEGMPGALYRTKHLFHIDEHVFLTCADMIIESSFKPAIDAYQKQKKGARILSSYMEDTAGFSLFKKKGELVTQFYEKNSDRHQEGLIDLGNGLYPYDVFEKISTLYPSETEVFLPHLQKLYVEEKNLTFTELKGWWSDVGKNLQEFSKVNDKYNEREVVIIGAGMAGLAAGITLSKAGHKPFIIEKANRPGGLFSNSTVAGCDFDYGPKILLLDNCEYKDEILQYLKKGYDKLPIVESLYLSDLGLLKFPIQRYLHQLPEKEKNQAVADLKKAKESDISPTNFREWLYKNYGEYLSDKVLIPYEEKKWQTSLDEMDYSWALSRPIKVSIDEMIQGSKKELPAKGSYYYPSEGNISALTEAMAKDAGNISLNTVVERINFKTKEITTNKGTIHYKYLISSIPLDDFVSFVDDIPEEYKQKSDELLDRLSIVVYNFVFKGNFDLEGTAIYFPEEEYVFRRVSILENLCPALSRDGLTPISVEVSLPGNKLKDSATLQSRVLKDLRKVPQFKQLGYPIAFESQFVDFAYPQQKRGHSFFVGELHKYFEEKDIYHIGRGGKYDYCNGDVAYSQGVKMAERVMKSHDTQNQKVTVGIPSYKSGESIITTVKSIIASETQRDIEILISVDGNTMSNSIEKKLKKLGAIVIHNKKRQGQTARNKQLGKLAKTNLLILTQDDVVFDKSTVEEIVTAFEQDRQLTMVGVHVTPLAPKTVFERVIQPGVKIARSLSKSWNNGDNYLSSVGRCLAYKTEMFQNFNIDNSVINCDAYYYFENKRLGGKFVFLSNTKTYFRLPQNLTEHLKQVRKFVISQKELDGYLEMNLADEYQVPPLVFAKSLVAQTIKNPVFAILYILVSIYSRTRSKSFYKKVSLFWEVDASTKDIKE